MSKKRDTFQPAYFERNYSNLRFTVGGSEASPGLRSAQIAAAHAVSAHFFQRTESAIVVMPTGSGKTGVMMLSAFLLRARRVLVVTPSRMVRDQLSSDFNTLMLLRRVNALENGIELPRVKNVTGRLKSPEEWGELETYHVVVATAQSSSPHYEDVARPEPDLFDVIFLDEAHHAPAPSWTALASAFPKARQVLFTATPFRRDERKLPGNVVFEYPLARARDDGVFGRLRYEPIEAAPGGEDRALAHAADARVRSARAGGSKALVMVRTAQRSRAFELARLYDEKTSLKLMVVDSGLSQKKIQAAITDLREGRLDGVICVDMLGEGFDLPELKIAVLHSPHRSLGVTLQFIGRFARTGDGNLGEATFLAVPREIEGEAAQLYRRGAEWNEIVEEVSRVRIQQEREAREILRTFVAMGDTSSLDDAAPLDVASIAPSFHVKVYRPSSKIDLRRFRPPIGEVLLLERSDPHGAVVCVTRHSEPYRWCEDPRVAQVSHSLIVLFYHPGSDLLFVGSSAHDPTTYALIVESLTAASVRPLAPYELQRVLRGLAGAVFFNVGMRRRAGHHESYRIMSGGAADKAIQLSDARFFDHGHCFGKGVDSGDAVTIGFSTAANPNSTI